MNSELVSFAFDMLKVYSYQVFAHFVYLRTTVIYRKGLISK
ncbi:hypothetical protein MUS_3781 [Bacillus velezensis YAU B9601-Y2]|uniref:Uncharacterized protein n=1 Tax=Bacillus amyloliquefaciens (strain Y2) TaxID=1155777 RepID=I2CAG7_BACAY|nr:hypothetical protein MUS_3781 [Bacillus velezensis YAU B9601-Y2]